MKRIVTGFIATVLAVIVVEARAVEKNRTLYQDALAKIENAYKARSGQILDGYIERLGVIRNMAQASGDLKMVQAVMAEAERARKERTLPPPDSGATQHIDQAADQARLHVRQMILDRAGNIVALSEQYGSALEARIRDLTRKGEIDAAATVQLEMKTMRESDVTTMARAQLDAAREEREQPEQPDEQGEDDAPDADPPEPKGLALARMYKGGLAPPKNRMAELKQMLSPHATANTDMTPQPGLEIYKGITYLMNVEDALQALTGRRLSASVSVSTPGMPRHSIRRYTATLREGGFNKVIILADLNQQVVGIQLTAENPSAPLAHHTRPNHSLYNIAENRAVSSPRSRVAWQSSSDGRIVRVNSAMWDDRNRLQECSTLYLAKPFADIVMDVIDSY